MRRLSSILLDMSVSADGAVGRYMTARHESEDNNYGLDKYSRGNIGSLL